MITGDKKITVECKWSDNLPKSFIDDFISVYQKVFKQSDKNLIDWFDCKFLRNPMGASLISIAYLDEKPVGIDAMWRNDIGGKVAYQTVDTGTDEAFRGLGIFRKITEKELLILGKDVLIYGFPNPKSFPGYVKFGWKVLGCKRNVIFTGIASYEKYYEEDASYEYVRWLFLDSKKKIYYIRKRDQYFLITPTRSKRIYHIISRVDEKTALLFENKSGVINIFLMSKLSKRVPQKYMFLPLIATSEDCISVPFWKLDV